MNERAASDIVLGIYPITRGVAFVLLKSPLAPIDWGIKGATGRDKNARFLKTVAALIDLYQPDVIVLEDPTSPRLRRAPRIERFTRAVESLAGDQQIDVHRYARAAVQGC